MQVHHFPLGAGSEADVYPGYNATDRPGTVCARGAQRPGAAICFLPARQMVPSAACSSSGTRPTRSP